MSGHAAVRQSVVSCLTAILDVDQRQRKEAEEELKALEVTEEFGLVLAELAVANDSPLAYRQLASVVLKQYVEVHWSKLSEKFSEPLPSDETKKEIRTLLPAGLNDSHGKIRATVAYAISAIAQYDWPDEWPELFEQLMTALASGQPHLVHGAMRVLSEFCHDVSDQQMPHVAPLILPHLLKVLVQPEVYSVRTRTRAVHIFSVTANLIYAMSERFVDAPSTLLFPTLANYISAFGQILSSSDEANTDAGLRKEVIMSLCSLLRCFPHALHPHIMEIVTPVWNILVTSAPFYVRTVVNSLELPTEVCDSDGEVIGQESTIFAIFEFITVLGESTQLQKLLPQILPDLVYHLITYMQVTHEQVHTWLSDINQFVEEDENEFSYSVRLSGLDLLLSLSEENSLTQPVYGAVVSAIERHLQEIRQNQVAIGEHWWKIHEACVLAVSCVVDAVRSQQAEFDCETFAQGVLMPDLAAGVSPLLTGRCLWLAGKMGPFLKPDTLTQLLQTLASGLQPSQHSVIRVLSAKAAFYFCSELHSSEHVQLLRPYLSVLIDGLVELAGNSPEDVVPLVVESLQVVAQVDAEVTAQCSAKLVPMAIALFLKYSHDPGISSGIEELLGTLATNPGCHGALHSRFLPLAVEILQSTESQLPLGIVAVALDVLVLIVRGCGNVEGGVPTEFVTEVFPCVVQRVLSSDDSAILQNGGECVRAFVATSVEKLAHWVDASGRNGLRYVVEVILHVLDPGGPEFSASYVGKLIIVFIKKAGNALGDQLELLLRATLSKMQSVQTSSVMQSLLVVFAHLVQTQLEAVLSFLSQVPDPRGRPALSFVMTEWCNRHVCFFGVYETRVSTLALCKLLSHCIASGDERLTKITVHEEVMGGVDGQGIQTRSKTAAAPRQWKEVPLPVKLVKLLVSDLQTQLESKALTQDTQSDEEEEEVPGEEWGGADSLEALLAPASAYPGYDAIGQMDEWDESEDDPDLQDEPVLQLDLQAHLAQYLLQLSQQSCFPSFLPLLTDLEKHTLRTIGVHC